MDKHRKALSDWATRGVAVSDTLAAMTPRYLTLHDGDDCTVVRVPDALTATDAELDARLEAVLDRIMDDLDRA